MWIKLLIMATAAAFVACGGNTQKKSAESPQTEVADMHNAENSLDIAGVYTGTYPAADCPGIEVTLTLNGDGTYVEHNKYLERDSEFDEKGSYSVEGNILTQTPADEGAPSYYKVEENRLLRLDAEKQVVTGPLAENYILKKSE